MAKHNKKSHNWHLEVYVPNKSGKRKANGEKSDQEKYMLSYMRMLFQAFEEALEDVRGIVRIYEGF